MAEHRSRTTARVGIGLASLEWLDALCSDPSGVYRFPGNVWVAEGDRVADSGDEQPLEALGLMEAHVAALDVTGDGAHAEAASRCFAWFLGANVSRDGACRLQHRSVLRRARPRAELQLRRRVHARVPASGARASQAGGAAGACGCLRDRMKRPHVTWPPRRSPQEADVVEPDGHVDGHAPRPLSGADEIFVRHPSNPILTAADLPFEANVVFNPGRDAARER